jgi:hypothetical protein
MQLARWLWWTLGLLVLSFALFALPADFEGPVLVPISSGHAIAVLDAAAIVPLVIASALLYAGVWRSRARLRESARSRPGVAVWLAFTGGLGLGLLLASVYSGFFGWWAIGAALLTAAMVTAAASAAMR